MKELINRENEDLILITCGIKGAGSFEKLNFPITLPFVFENEYFHPTKNKERVTMGLKT